MTVNTVSQTDLAFAASARLPITMASPLDGEERVLFVLTSYPGVPNEVSRDAGIGTRAALAIIDLVTLRRHRSYREMYRDHYANVRSVDYMRGLVDAVTRAAAMRNRPGLVADAATPAGPADQTAVERRDLRAMGEAEWRAAIAAGPHSAVVLVWPDALGLGSERLEGLLAGMTRVYALNGRRRLFRLDAAMRAKLARRRFFAYTRVAELSFALASFPVAAACAAIDRLKRH